MNEQEYWYMRYAEDQQYREAQHAAIMANIEKQYGFYQLCPKCYGQKKVLYPPYLPAGVESFSSSQTEWPCDICKGEGVLIRPEIKPQTTQPKEDADKKATETNP